MKIYVYVNKQELVVDLPDGSCVADIVNNLGIPADCVGIAVISGQAVRKDHLLTDGDIVTLHPPIVGG